MTVLTDDEYLIVEPCVSCEKSYTEDISDSVLNENVIL